MGSVTLPVMGASRSPSLVSVMQPGLASSRRHLSAWSFIKQYLPFGASEEKKADTPPSEEKKADTPPSDDKAAETSSPEEKTADASLPSSAQVDAVTASWDKVAALGAETVGVLLFKRIFEIA